LNNHMPSSAMHVPISTLQAMTAKSNFLLMITLQRAPRPQQLQAREKSPKAMINLRLSHTEP
jgi:hypothetical protein